MELAMAARPRLLRTLRQPLRTPVQKYAVAVGELVWASNDCLNYCAMIYREMFDNDHINIAVRTWHLQRSDAAQRDLVAAAVKGNRTINRPFNHVLRDEILWAIDKAGLLSEKRNDAAHSTTRFHIDHKKKWRVITSSVSTLPKRVERLSKQKNLIAYFNVATRDLIALTSYFYWLWMHVREETNAPLPHRPKLRSVA
jgi:ribonuclease D